VQGAASLSGVRVVWTATRPEGGRFVVGWYDDATVFRRARGRHPNPPLGTETLYLIVTRAANAHLIPADERCLYPVPDCRKRGVSWGMGQSNVRYLNEDGLAYLHDLERRLFSRRTAKAGQAPRGTGNSGTGRQLDAAKRIEVENAAMDAVIDHFGDQWRIEDRSRVMGLGYDLRATPRDARRASELLLEVKGCSGATIACELTPSEWACMRARTSRSKYRLCVVTNALDRKARRIHIFKYHPALAAWTTTDGQPLAVERVVGARCSAKRVQG